MQRVCVHASKQYMICTKANELTDVGRTGAYCGCLNRAVQDLPQCAPNFNRAVQDLPQCEAGDVRW